MSVDTTDKSDALLAALEQLTRREVLVGIAQESANQHGTRGGSISNAALGYIFESGAPEINMPARPWLRPGVEDVRDAIAARLAGAGRAALAGDSSAVEQQFAGAGQDAVNAVRRRIQAGIAPPLAQSTVDKRRRRSAGSSYRRRAATAADATPLIDTGDFVRSITYVVRDR